ncbi:hypothetical protein Pse7367_2229 [Thalassoporum mexicanum PCC 7367]|uniref:NADAR family protein n=1 Tax=Thalassoporum mexicanum TaxID=3457544 RepID=UPI00029FE5BD|nr:NADAR family protein [Pseudanabaena sp. PCC 7367]AFY70493.1 hypothetical protein Pse7367_2229 [Pseudanabaena sp. PCC 7367]
MVVTAKRPESITYQRKDCITFRKTKEKFGGLSNMAGGYPLVVNGLKILSSEALYQACRFPDLPEVQRLIIAQRSPMTAKMKSKPYREQSRSDWEEVRHKVMRWCLQVKLIHNWEKFSNLLLQTGDLPIVEDSRKDDFWGAKPQNGDVLLGRNMLGGLLMQLREQIRRKEITSYSTIEPLTIPNFLLYGKAIASVSVDKYDVFYVALPAIEEFFKEVDREITPKEIAKVFNVPAKLMNRWLNHASRLGKVKKHYKPIRYSSEPQLKLLESLVPQTSKVEG